MSSASDRLYRYMVAKGLVDVPTSAIERALTMLDNKRGLANVVRALEGLDEDTVNFMLDAYPIGDLWKEVLREQMTQTLEGRMPSIQDPPVESPL